MHFSLCIKIAKVWVDVGLHSLRWGLCKPRRKIQGGTKTPDSLQSSEDAPRNAEENERVKRVSERDRVRSITCVYSRHVSAQKNISLVKQEEGDRHWRIDDHLLGAGQLLTTLFLHARLSKDGKGSEWGFERPVGGGGQVLGKFTQPLNIGSESLQFELPCKLSDPLFLGFPPFEPKIANSQ